MHQVWIKFKENKKENKGFTLVELIVVLVILAILAAILVPALLGYIDRARQNQIILNAKSCLTAAQAEMSSLYAQDATSIDNSAKDRILNTALDDKSVCESLVIGCKAAMTAGSKDGYTITYVAYKQGGKTIYYNGSAWVETAPAAPAKTYTIYPTS
jgi:prepilin-type N-terminal cleavage/methylation domain-containing protein